MKRTKKSISLIVTALLSFVLCVFMAACTPDDPPPEQPTEPIKVSDGIEFELAAGKSKNLTVADYITVNGNAVSASSSDNTKATATVDGGILTVTAMPAVEGDATVSLTCEDITVSFEVSVYIEYTVTVDGAATPVRKDGAFTLPAAPTPADPNFEFDYWLVDTGDGTVQKDERDVITVNSNVTVTSVTKRKAAVKVNDGGPLSVTMGTPSTITVEDYITTYGNTVSANSSDNDVATAAVTGGTLTVTPVSTGTAVVTLTCLTVNITFNVTVSPAPPATYTVKVDGVQVAVKNAGETYILPSEPSVADADYEFICWKVNGVEKQPGAPVDVNENLEIIAKIERKAPEKVRDGEPIIMTIGDDPVTFDFSYYITTHGHNVSVSQGDDSIATANLSSGVVTVAAVAVGNTTVSLTCGTITVTCAVTVNAEDPNAPKFTNGSISYDRYETASGTCNFVFTEPDGKTFDYDYALATADANAAFSGNSLTYTATAAVTKNITVKVTATDTTDPTNIKHVSFNIAITVTDSAPTVKVGEVNETTTVLDIFDNPTIDLAANINNVGNVASYKVDGETNGIADGVYTLSDNAYTAVPSEVTFNVVATNTKGGTVSYTYKVKVVNSAAYRVENGDFETGNTAGWTASGGDFFNITNANDYFGGAYGKDGTWLLSGAEDRVDGVNQANGKETGTGTLTSSAFTLKKNAVISFKLGGAKNPTTGIRILDGSGNILAQFYNTAFADGVLVQYYYAFDNASEIANCKVCIYDDATADWGLVEVDSIVTYYADSFVIPAGANMAVNVYADKTELTAAIASAQAITEQGDYTQESYDALVAALNEAIEANNDYALPADVNAKATALSAALDSLEFRVPVAKDDMTTAMLVAPSASIEINIASYFDTKQLSKITYSADTESDLLSLGAVVGGKVTVTAGSEEEDGIVITISVLYDGAVKATVDITVDISSVVLAPVVTDDAGLSGAYDLFDHKESDGKVTLDLESNITKNDNGTLKYFVKVGDGEYGAQIVDPTKFEFKPSGDFTETASQILLTVKVEYEATAGNGDITYTYALDITDTTRYRLVNGGFDEGLDVGWTLSNPDLGAVNEATSYWDDKISFNADGKFFNAYTNFKADDPTVVTGGNEAATGTLTSATFTVGGSGWMTYKLGGAKNIEYVYMEVVKEDGTAVKLPNFDFTDYVGEPKRGCTLISYKVNLIDYCGFAKGDVVYVRVTDNASGDYGLFFLDSVFTYYESEPVGDYSLVSKYKLYNGGFETGNATGWTASGGDFFNITNANDYFGGAYGKDGSWLLSGAEDRVDGVNQANGRETGTGTLTSSAFTLKKNAVISFKLGGAKNPTTGIRILDGSGNILAQFYNTAFADGVLVQYYYAFDNASEIANCKVCIYDDATADWGLVEVDSIITDYADSFVIPAGANMAVSF